MCQKEHKNPTSSQKQNKKKKKKKNNNKWNAGVKEEKIIKMNERKKERMNEWMDAWIVH